MVDTTSTPAEALAAMIHLAKDHASDGGGYTAPRCQLCGEEWPCLVATLVDGATELARQLDAAIQLVAYVTDPAHGQASS